MFLGTRSKLIAVFLIVAAAFAGGYYWNAYAHRVPAASTIVDSGADHVPSGVRQAPVGVGLPDFSSIVTAQGPAVVNISVTSSKQVMNFPRFPGFQGDDADNPFNEFFRRFNGGQPPQAEPAHGLGSGFIVSPDGVILTNAHVVDDASDVVVKLTDKREFHAKLIGSDKASDVAVLKISGKALPIVKVGSATDALVGDWVLAIGAPFGFENTATAGIISAKSRSLPNEGYVPFLQTDVAINPGNSGGPLFNTNGEVIGINSQIYSQSGGYQGLSFAIPIDLAMKVAKQLLQNGKVSHGRLGVTIQEVNQQLADSFGLEKPKGALVSSAEKDGPADKAGIKSGDVILKFNGQNIDRSTDLPPLVGDINPGTKVAVQIWRERKAVDMTVTVGESTQVASSGPATTKAETGKLGLAVRPLTSAEMAQADVKAGLYVEEVAGPAQRAGIRSGDIVIAVNGVDIKSVDQLRSAIKSSGKHLAILISRNGEQSYVPVTIDK